jgi:predicted nucleic acid-binding Zn ribbon protein
MKKQTPPQRIAEVLEQVLSQQGYLSACLENEMMLQWPVIVGPHIAGVTQCLNAENGILYVRVHHAAWRQEISFVKTEILAKIRNTTRCKTITDIVFC